MRKVAKGNQVQNIESKMEKRGCEAANLKGLLPHWGSHFVALTVSPCREFRKEEISGIEPGSRPTRGTRDGAYQGGG